MAYHVNSTEPCDACDKTGYSSDNPLVEVRLLRPSDPMDVCCIMAGHARCLGWVEGEQQCSPHGGVGTPEQWDKWLSGDFEHPEDKSPADRGYSLG